MLPYIHYFPIQIPPKQLDRPVITALASTITSITVAIYEQYSDYVQPTGVRDCDNNEHQGIDWLEACLSDERQLKDETRLNLEAFTQLATILEANKYISTSKFITIQEKLLIFLYIYGQGASWRNTRWRCGHSLDTIST